MSRVKTGYERPYENKDPGHLESSCRGKRGWRVSYESILLRHRQRVTDDASESVPHLSVESETDGLASGTQENEQTGNEGGHLAGKHPTPSGASPLASIVSSASLTVADTLHYEQNDFIELSVIVAAEVAAFSENKANILSGYWEINLPIDPAKLPETVLYISLSPHELSLRFDAQNVKSRQLISDHRLVLKRELTKLMRAWSVSRIVDVTIS
jgi:Type III secretion protein (HpaP)